MALIAKFTFEILASLESYVSFRIFFLIKLHCKNKDLHNSISSEEDIMLQIAKKRFLRTRSNGVNPSSFK